MAVAADVGNAEDCARLVSEHLERYGRLDVLVNSAGIGFGGTVEDLAAKHFDLQVGVNLRGLFLVTQAAIPLLRESRGWIVNLASIAGTLPAPGLATYGATKAAVISLTRSLNEELEVDGVRAVAICPGFVDTAMAQWSGIPTDEMIRPEDCAEVVRMVLRLSPHARVPQVVIERVGLEERRCAARRSVMTLADFPRVPLLFGPSPVHRLERLSEHLGGAVEIWAKREDCNSGLAYGGNKMRKLEYLAADALAQGCDTLVSIGGVQSNHTRQVAAVAAQLGLGCVLVQEHWVDWDDPVYDKVGNILLSRIMGADVRLSDRPASTSASGRAGRRRSPTSRRAAASRTRSRPAPPTIRSAATASRAGRDEVAEQERELGVFFDTIVVCSVTGSTQAGMIAGFAGQERAAHACSASTARRRWSRRGSRSRGSRAARPRRSGSAATLADDEIVLLDEWHAGTYGIPDAKTIEAIRLCARLEGMLTDPVYEGKSMAALIDLVQRRPDRARLARALRPPRRPAGAERRTPARSSWATATLFDAVWTSSPSIAAVARIRTECRASRRVSRSSSLVAPPIPHALRDSAALPLIPNARRSLAPDRRRRMEDASYDRPAVDHLEREPHSAESPCNCP